MVRKNSIKYSLSLILNSNTYSLSQSKLDSKKVENHIFYLVEFIRL